MQGMNSGHTYGHAWYMNDDNTYSYHSNDFSCDNAIHCSGDLQFDQNFKGTQTQIEVCDSSVCYWSQVMNVSSLTGSGGNTPTADAHGPYTVAEGSTVTLSGLGSDPNNDPLTYTWDLDNNGTFETSGQNPVFSAVGRDGPSTQHIVLQVCDTSNNCATSGTDVTITNVVPSVGTITTSPSTIHTGSSFTATAAFTDPGESDTHTANWDWGDGSSTTGTVTESNGSGSVSNSHTYTVSGSHTITLTVTDKDSASGTHSYSLFVNGFPLVTPNFTAADIVFDPSGHVTSFDSNYANMQGMNGHAWYMNDDNTYSYHSNDFSCDNSIHCSGDLQFDQNFKGTQTQIEVCDSTVCYWSQVLDVSVLNGRPIVGTVTVSPNPVQTSTSVTATATFTDTNTEDTHTATVDWGDGSSPTSCSVTESTGAVSCTRSSGYSTANVYSVTVTVSDGTLTGTSPVTFVSVYNPTQSSIFTAGQRYTSAAGAYRPNTSLTGNVTFGLSYKYQGTMPVGVRAFTMDFNAANLSFNATTVSSLVITNGKATLRGTGTVTNQSGTYSFLVTGLDGTGGNGKIRIQIKDVTGTVIYDTQYQAADTADPTTAVNGAVVVN